MQDNRYKDKNVLDRPAQQDCEIVFFILKSYNIAMRNWSTDVSKFDKQSPAYRKWRMEQLINFGLDREKLDSKELKKYINILNVDPYKKSFLQFLLQNNA